MVAFALGSKVFAVRCWPFFFLKGSPRAAGSARAGTAGESSPCVRAGRSLSPRPLLPEPRAPLAAGCPRSEAAGARLRWGSGPVRAGRAQVRGEMRGAA